MKLHSFEMPNSNLLFVHLATVVGFTMPLSGSVATLLLPGGGTCDIDLKDKDRFDLERWINEAKEEEHRA
jgi:hypothetical protein